jgi:hypothetical protein
MELHEGKASSEYEPRISSRVARFLYSYHTPIVFFEYGESTLRGSAGGAELVEAARSMKLLDRRHLGRIGRLEVAPGHELSERGLDVGRWHFSARI